MTQYTHYYTTYINSIINNKKDKDVLVCELKTYIRLNGQITVFCPTRKDYETAKNTHRTIFNNI